MIFHLQSKIVLFFTIDEVLLMFSFMAINQKSCFGQSLMYYARCSLLILHLLLQVGMSEFFAAKIKNYIHVICKLCAAFSALFAAIMLPGSPYYSTHAA